MNNMPWTNSYPAGVRWDKDITPAPLQTILDNTVAKWPDRPAIDFMGKRLSYRELGDYVNRAACGLQQLGVKPGVHVGLYLPNTPHYIIAFFAVLKAGGTVVNYSPLDAAAVLEHKIEDSRTDFLITLDMAVALSADGDHARQDTAEEIDCRQLGRDDVRARRGDGGDESRQTTERNCMGRSACQFCQVARQRRELTRFILLPIRGRRLLRSSTPGAPPACPRARC